MDYLPLSDNAARQLIDSTTIFDEFRRVLEYPVEKFRGSSKKHSQL